MRKIIVLSFITLDGVMQAPGGPEEDPIGGFTSGGWTVPYFDDFLGQTMTEQMSRPFDLLLGRKTYEIFAAYWPHQKDPGAAGLNNAKKYVASKTPLKLDWSNSTLISGDLVQEIKKLKKQDGPELQVHGSGNLIQTLLKHDLVDELWLKIFPIIWRVTSSGEIDNLIIYISCNSLEQEKNKNKRFSKSKILLGFGEFQNSPKQPQY